MRFVCSLLLVCATLALAGCGETSVEAPDVTVDDAGSSVRDVEQADPLLAGQDGVAERLAREVREAREAKAERQAQRIREELTSDDPEAGARGLDAVVALGAEGMAYLDDVLPQLSSQALGVKVVQALVALGPRAVEPSCQYIATQLAGDWHYDGTGTVKPAHAHLTQLMNQWGDLAVPHVVPLLAEERTAVWAEGTISAWQRQGRADMSLVVPTSIAILERGDGSSASRSAAIRLLGHLGRDAAPAVGALARVLDGRARTHADALHIVRTFKKIGPQAEDALTLLERLREDARWQRGPERIALAEALAAIRARD